MLACLLFTPAVSDAQERRRTMFEDSVGAAALTVVLSSTRGVELAATEHGRLVFLTPRAPELLAWVDSASAILSRTITPAAGEELVLRTEPIYGTGSHVTLTRTVTPTTSRQFLGFVGRSGYPILAVPLEDSAAVRVLGALRMAATTLVTEAGRHCDAQIAAMIAKRGAPSSREFGGNNAVELYEQLTFKGRFSTKKVFFIWSAAAPDCRISEI